MSFFGIPYQLFPLDAHIIQELLFKRPPSLILETGTASGGSSAYYSMLMGLLRTDARIVTVDVEDRFSPELKEGGRLYSTLGHRIERLHGSSVDRAVLSRMHSYARSEKDIFVSLDSDHSKSHVFAELLAYAPMVPIGCYLLVQDTRLSRGWFPSDGYKAVESVATSDGPIHALREFAALAKWRGCFTNVARAERLLISNHPGGWLQRVKCHRDGHDMLSSHIRHDQTE